MTDHRRYIEGENEARRSLRQEVAFGCPLCRNPFLTYHHFDPPWHEKHHWDPKGIIALCREHHDQAEGGHYTKEFLRQLKGASYSVDDVKSRFPWARSQFVVRLGGLYSGGSRTVLRLGGEPIVQLTTGEEGLLSLSFDLRSNNGRTVAKMTENVFEVGPRPPADLRTTTTATKIEIWYEVGEIAVDVSLRQVTPDELGSVLKADRDRAQAKVATLVAEKLDALKECLEHLPPDIANEIQTMCTGTLRPQTEESISRRARAFRQLFGDSQMPDHVLQALVSGDPVADSVNRWANANCRDSDGRISLLNFDNLSVFSSRGHVRIRNGIGNLDYNAAFDCDTAFNL